MTHRIIVNVLTLCDTMLGKKFGYEKNYKIYAEFYCLFQTEVRHNMEFLLHH